MDQLTPHEGFEAGARWAPALRALGDERLARMAEGGSDVAFTAIYGRYAPVLHGYCRSLLRDEEEAGDALQNAMLKALQAMRRSARTGPLRPWLFRIAHNESVTIIRARIRRPGPLDDALIAGADDAFRHAVAREQLAALLEDMQYLTEYQRGALVMRELGGLTYDEIGLALDTSPLAARQAVFVARKRLREGSIAPRRLRPALRALIPPGPAGFALWGLLGGGGGATAGKALIGAAAALSVGVGSVEVVKETPVAPPPKTLAKAPSRTHRAPRHHAAATTTVSGPRATATPAVARIAARTAVAAATPRAARAQVHFVEVAATSTPAAHRDATSEARPTPTAAPEHHASSAPSTPAARPVDHPAAPSPTPTAASPPPYRSQAPPVQPAMTTRQAHPNCPQPTATPADATSDTDSSVPPVQ